METSKKKMVPINQNTLRHILKDYNLKSLKPRAQWSLYVPPD